VLNLTDGPKKLSKNDSRKKFIDLDDIKEKATSIKDKNRSKLNIKDKAPEPFRRDNPPQLGKSDHQNILSDIYNKLRAIPLITDKRLILIIIFIILIGVVGFLAVNSFKTTANKTNTTNNTPLIVDNHFDNGLISFDYPKGWNVTNGTQAPVIVTVSKDENNSFVVMNEYLNKTTFTDRVATWRQNILQTGAISYENNITIDNTTGYSIEAIYRVNNTTYNARGVAVSKNNTIYFLMFIFKGSLLDYKDEMNQVINSFHIVH
jgi:hypothetical protein